MFLPVRALPEYKTYRLNPILQFASYRNQSKETGEHDTHPFHFATIF
jgi:hypothetical protein